MKRLTLLGLSVYLWSCATLPIAAQTSISERDSSDISLFERITKMPKRNKVFNLDLNLHSTFNVRFADGRADEAAFHFNYIQVQASGEVTDRLFYLYRQNLNGSNGEAPLENLNGSIEYAMIGYRLTDRLTLTAGKQDIAWGGFEYDYDPYTIYQYSDMNDYLDCYFTGVTLGYEFTPAQELRLQVANNRFGSMEDAFGMLPDGIEKPFAPLYYTLNWNSSYADEALNLRYSFTAGQQAKDRWSYMAWAGHNVCVGPFDGYFDVMYTRGALDPLGLISELRVASEEEADEYYPCAQNTDYLSLVAELNYRFHPKWNLFAKGTYETASVYKDTEYWASGRYRTSWGYQGGVAFYPMADDNLHFFLMGAGRTPRLTENAKTLGASEESTARLTVGFIYRLPLF